MLSIDSDQGPVELPVFRQASRPWVWGLLPALMALAVAGASFLHPVHWWGWLGAGVLLAGGLVLTRLPARAPGITSCTADGDTLLVASHDRVERIEAREVVRVAGRSEATQPILVLRDGRHLQLPLRQYWQQSAVPTARLLARWVRAHGGGTGEWDGTLPAGPPGPPRRRMVLWALFALALWVSMNLCLSAIVGRPGPHFHGGGGGFVGALLGGEFARRAAEQGPVKDWMAPPPTS